MHHAATTDKIKFHFGLAVHEALPRRPIDSKNAFVFGFGFDLLWAARKERCFMQPKEVSTELAANSPLLNKEVLFS